MRMGIRMYVYVYGLTLRASCGRRPEPVIMRTSEGDMRMMLLLWDATSLKIVEIPIKTTLNNPDFPEK